MQNGYVTDLEIQNAQMGYKLRVATDVINECKRHVVENLDRMYGEGNSENFGEIRRINEFMAIQGQAEVKAKPTTQLEEMSDSIREYMEGAVGVVEANSFEQTCLWERHSKTHEWKSSGVGYGVLIGADHDRPVFMSLTYVMIDGHKILFIDLTSMLVNWTMVDRWLEKNLPETAMKGTYANKTDAMNFLNIIPRT